MAPTQHESAREKVIIGKDKKVKDYGNDPFFLKKARESKSFLEKHGFPKDSHRYLLILSTSSL